MAVVCKAIENVVRPENVTVLFSLDCASLFESKRTVIVSCQQNSVTASSQNGGCPFCDFESNIF